MKYFWEDTGMFLSEGGQMKPTHPENVSLCPKALGAYLHHGVGAEGDTHFVLADSRQPQRHIALQLQRGHQDGLVT